jgi:hypothetical protein
VATRPCHYGDRAETTPEPLPITPGPEMAALRRFHRDTTWTGTTQAGGMGPGTPLPTVVIRLTWELVDDHTLLWRNEARVGEGHAAVGRGLRRRGGGLTPLPTPGVYRQD